MTDIIDRLVKLSSELEKIEHKQTVNDAIEAILRLKEESTFPLRYSDGFMPSWYDGYSPFRR